MRFTKKKKKKHINAAFFLKEGFCAGGEDGGFVFSAVT